MCTRQAAVSLAVGVLVLVVAACGADGANVPQAESTATVRGAIVAVNTESLLELTSLDLQDEAGTRWHFEARHFTGLTPSHLGEHMVQGLPIIVMYHRENGVLIIDEITD